MSSSRPRSASPQGEVRFLDTTLRDGDQAPGSALMPAAKLKLAEQLARLGVDVIEAGFPASSPGQFEAVRQIAATVRTPVIAALCRAVPEDIDLAWEAIHEAERGRLKVMVSTSDIHLASVVRMTRADVVEAARESVRRARRLVEDVQFSAQDATRTDPAFLLEVYRAAVAEGATTVNIADTVGYVLPHEFGRLVSEVQGGLPDDVVVSVHCHDDLGLAAANSLAGVMHGARQVEVTINGMGERAGNCPLEEMVMILSTRADALGLTHRINVEQIARTSRLVAELTGYAVHPSKAVVGANAFVHESGIHQGGMLADPASYQIMDPLAIGRSGSRIALGKQSGRRGFASVLEEMGLRLDPKALDRAFARYKALADEKFPVTEADLRALVADELPRPAPASAPDDRNP